MIDEPWPPIWIAIRAIEPTCANERPAARCFVRRGAPPAWRRFSISASASRLRCVYHAPFGAPVVPLVNRSRWDRRARAPRPAGAAEALDDRPRARPDVVGRQPLGRRELRQLRPERLDDPAEIGVEPVARAEQALRARLAEHVADLRPSVAHVDAGRDRAEASGRHVGDGVERRRRQQECHDVAAPDAARGEPAGQAIGERVPVAVREALVAIAEGVGLRGVGRGCTQQRGNGGGGRHHAVRPRSRRYFSSRPTITFSSPNASMRSPSARRAVARERRESVRARAPTRGRRHRHEHGR